MQFLGYKRADGCVGIRNHVLVMPTCACSSDTARIISEHVPGTVSFHNQHGCGQPPLDLDLTLRIMSGAAANGNIYGVLLVALGCESAQCPLVESRIRKLTSKPVLSVSIQQEGGTKKTVAKGIELASKLVADAGKCRREMCDFSDLILGTECGGSDPTSGLSANLVIGTVSDRIVEAGGTSILSETTEIIGAEHLLAARARTPEIGQGFYRAVKKIEDHFANVGTSLRDGNPSPGNIASGITTIEEKSLGCIHKSGSHPFEAVYDDAERVTAKGMVFMDTPAYDVGSVMSMAAGGAQVVIFSTGMGTPTGNPIIPVIKITGNAGTAQRMADNIDFDTSDSIKGLKTVDELGEELLTLLKEVAEGRLVKAEELGMNEIAISRLCNFC